MPLYKSIRPNAHTVVHVWKIEEELKDLRKGVQLKKVSQERLDGMKSELHQKGFLSVRKLLELEGYSDLDVYYNSNGKPHLRDERHISITHSFYFSAIIIGNTDVGVDIEMNREKIKKIQHRFVNTQVDSLSKEDLVSQLTVIWGAKEAMYKIYPHGGLSFHDHIAIDPFLLGDGRTSGRINLPDWPTEYRIHFDSFENMTLVYALPETDQLARKNEAN